MGLSLPLHEGIVMLKFSPANAKIKTLSEVDAIKPFLQGKKKVYSLDLLSGWTCPGAHDCLSKVRVVDGRRVVSDGPDTKFRCFSASQEAVYTGVYNLRNHNTTLLQNYNDVQSLYNLINDSLPPKLGVCRIHVGGDFFSPNYMLSWGEVAKNNPDKLFYAYTKSLGYWIRNREFLDSIPNLVLTASYGGRLDHLIKSEQLRSAKVIMHPAEAEGLEIDHTDEHAADPSRRNQDFALLIHGLQPAGSDASSAIKVLKQEKVQYAYSN